MTSHSRENGQSASTSTGYDCTTFLYSFPSRVTVGAEIDVMRPNIARKEPYLRQSAGEGSVAETNCTEHCNGSRRARSPPGRNDRRRQRPTARWLDASRSGEPYRGRHA